MISRLNTARMLLAAGLAVGLLSWKESVGHIGNADFLVPAYPLGPTHAWYHVFREACGDIAKMAVLILVFFGPPPWRTPVTWWIGLILMLGYYAPFWIGEPFLSVLSAPIPIANWIHLAMALPAFMAIGLARPAFMLPERKHND